MIRALAVLLVLAGPAGADGLDDAVAAWIAADDATAMPALKSLAEAGDSRAMLFLGAIEPRPMVTDYMLGLDRRTRNALLRRPGGLSGKSWLDLIPSDDPQRPFADALMAARAGDPTPLLSLGQTGAAVQPLLRMFNEVPGRLASLSRDAPLSADLAGLVWLDALLPAEAMPDATAADRQAWSRVADGLEAREPQGSLARLVVAARWQSPPVTSAEAAAGYVLMNGAVLDRDLLSRRGLDEATFAAGLELAAQTLKTAPEAAAHRAVCAPCPDLTACTLALWTASGNYLGAIWPGTPLDRFVPPDIHQDSPRRQAEILHAARAMPAAGIIDTCLATLIQP
jgi:hypothetical protein